MPRILILEGNTPDLPGAAGFFVATLTALDPTLVPEIANPYTAQPHFEGVDAVILTGAGVAWSACAPEAAPQRLALTHAIEAGLPIWGSCNGLHLATTLLGGTLRASPNGIEAGLARDIRITEAGQGHPMMTGRSPGYAAPCIHRDEVATLPGGATLLSGNAHSAVQACVVTEGASTLWLTQYHPECAPADIAAFLRAGGIFAPHAGLIPLLEAEEASALGLPAEALDLHQRACELAAWLDFVQSRTAPRAA